MPRWIHLAELALAAALTCALYFSWRADRRDRAQLAAQLAAAQQSITAADARQHDRDSQLAQTLASIAAQKRAADSATPQQILAALQRQLGLPLAPTMQPGPHLHDLREQGNDRSGKGTAASEQGSAGQLRAEAITSGTERFPASSAIVSENKPQSPRANLNRSADRATDSASSASFTSSTSSTFFSSASSRQIALPPADLKPLYNFALDCQSCQAKLAAAQGDLTDERVKTAALTRERDAALRAAKGGTLWHRVTRAAKWFALGAAAGALAAKFHHTAFVGTAF